MSLLTGVELRRHDSFKRVLGSPSLRHKLMGYLQHVFHIEAPASLYATIAAAVWDRSNKNDMDVYRAIQYRLAHRPLRGFFAARGALRQVSQLWQQKRDLTEQTVGLLHQAGVPMQTLRAYVTIGDPGRMVRPLQQQAGALRRVWVMHDSDEWSLNAAMERGALGAVGTHVPVDYNNWVASTGASVPSDSVDLVQCNMGLHHIRPEQLPTLLAFVKRVLRPGGLFIVREHDAKPALVPILDLAHAIFNAVLGVSPEAESRELRGFRPLKQWRKVLHGAQVSREERHANTHTYTFKESCLPHVTVLGVSLVIQLEDTLLYAALPAHLDPTVDVMMMFRKPLAGIGQADPVVPDMSTEDDGEGVDSIAPDVAKLLPPAAPTLGRQHSVPYSAEERTALQAAARHVGGIPALSQVDPEVSFYKLPEWLLVQAAQDFGNSLNETPW